MRKLIFILIVLVSFSQAQTIQYIGAPTTTVISRGNFRTDSIFYLPKRTKLPTDTAAFRYQISDSSLYYWTGYQWMKVGNNQDTASMLSNYVRGSGTTNYFPKFNSTRSVVDSKLYESNLNLLFNSTTPYLTTSGISTIENNGTSAALYVLKTLDTARAYVSFGGANTMDINNLRAGDIRFYTNATLRGRFQTDGTFRLNSLTGTGSRIVVADANGVLSATSSATELVDTTLLSTRAYRQKGDDSLGAIIATKGSGTVTSVATGYGLSGGTITTTGTISADSAIVASRLRVGKVVDSLALVKQNVLTNPVTGTGTSGQVSYFNGTSSVTGENALFWDATNDRLGIGTNTPAVKLSVLESASSTNTRVIVQQLQRGSSGTAANGVGGYLQLTAQDNAGAQREAGVVSWDLSNVSSANPQGRLLLGSRGVNDALIINNSGNIGIATNPNNWNRSTIQIGRGSIFSTAGEISTVMNAYNDGAFKYIINSGASQFLQINNTFQWNSADAGLPDSNFTFTRRMTLGADGELLLNTTTDAGAYVLQTNGSIYTSGSAVSQMVLNTTNANGSANLYQQSGSTIGWLGNGSSSVIGGSTSDFGINSQSALFFATGGYRAATINSSSELLIATTADAGDYKLQVNGNAYVTGTTVLAATSGTVGVATTVTTEKFNVGGAGNFLAASGGSTTGLAVLMTNATDNIDNGVRLAWKQSGATYETAYITALRTGANAYTSLVFATGASGWNSAAPTEKIRIHANGGLKFVGQSAAPTAEAGTVYYDTDDNKLKVYNGTTWVDLH